MEPPAEHSPDAGSGTAGVTSGVKPHDLSRRRFLEVLSTAGGAAVFASCGADFAPGEETAATAASLWVKDPEPFIRHGTSLETPLERLRGFLTPNELFFVRSHGPTPTIGPADYRATRGAAAARS